MTEQTYTFACLAADPNCKPSPKREAVKIDDINEAIINASKHVVGNRPLTEHDIFCSTFYRRKIKKEVRELFHKVIYHIDTPIDTFIIIHKDNYGR